MSLQVLESLTPEAIKVAGRESVDADAFALIQRPCCPR